MADVKQTLNGWIDYSSPKLGTVLARTWKNQQQAITYKEIREAIYSGQLDMSYLAQWQQDYSKFIINGYAPLAQQAIDNAAKGLAAKYGVGLRNTVPQYIDSFISQHGGQLIREVSVEQYQAINVLVRQASMSETMTVDQLARAIRPTVGLTQRQSQAALHYYQQAIDNGMTPEQARQAQALYAERLHRVRANTIAQTEMAYAYNYGEQAAIEQAIKDGLIGGADKEWSTAYDERVCEICGALDGQTVALDGTFSNGKQLPPAHPNCRCRIKYVNILPPAAFSQAAPGQPEVLQDIPEIPDDLDIKFLEYDGKVDLGGTGKMYAAHDNANTEYDYLFKPAESKSGVQEDFRAYVQEAGYKVQGVVDPDSAVECGVTTLDIPGKGQTLGAAQRRLDELDGSFDLKAWQQMADDQAAALDPNIIRQLQRENVTDYLLYNYDSHGGNFVLGKDGTLYGLDKEQAFRYIGEAKAQGMSLTYHPNSVYGEEEPIYNTLYRRFTQGQIDIRLNDTLAYIKRIEAIPDAEYREIFRGHAESLYGKGAAAESLLDQIVTRKQTVRSAFESFYSELLTKRKGTNTVFAFVDDAAAKVLTTPSVAATTLSPATLKTMKLADLQAMAKAKGIKNFGILHKDELIDIISDPSKQQQVFQTALDRAHKQYAAQVARRTGQAATAQAGRKINGITQLSDALKDIDGTLQGGSVKGVTLISDSSSLEGLQATLRKVEIDGKTYYELSGKMTQTRWEQANNYLSSQAQRGQWRFNEITGNIDYTQPTLHLSGSTYKISIPTQYIRNGDDILVIAGGDCDKYARAMMGEFNIRVAAADGAEAARKIEQLIRQANMTDICDDVTDAAITRWKKMRAIWQADPATAQSLNAVTTTDSQINAALQRLGITQQRLDAMQVKEIGQGYFTLIDPENVKVAAQEGVAYVWSGVGTADGAAAIIKSGEMSSSSLRLKRGIFGSGASVSDDIESGGADSVFARIAMKQNVGKEEFSRSFASGKYQFIFGKETLGRTDWYAYTGDEFGKTEPYTFYGRYGTQAHFQTLKKRYQGGNEVMFRKNLPTDNLTEIRTGSESSKQELINLLHTSGISHINGIRLEDFIKVGRML